MDQSGETENAAGAALAAQHATVPGALDLGALALIGTFAGPQGYRALVRHPGGRIVTLHTGDRLRGGHVRRIGAGEIEIERRGGNVDLLGLPGAG